MDMSKIQRALGLIEGVCAGLADKPAELIECAVNEIDCELESRKDTVQSLLGKPVRLSGVVFEEGDFMTSGEMEELTERLKKHFTDHVNGKPQNFEQVFRDCLLAAIAITQLGEQLKDQDFKCCMEQL